MSPLPETRILLDSLEARLGSGLIVGDMRLLPFRANALPVGWYHMNGDKYALTSAQGIVLDGFTATFKTDWKIIVASSQINLPTMYASDGRAYFERAVDGTTRQVGSEEGDATRNVQADMRLRGCWLKAALPQAPFGVGIIESAERTITIQAYNLIDYGSLDFDLSRVVPTAPENRVLNIGKTPAIYLGV